MTNLSFMFLQLKASIEMANEAGLEAPADAVKSSGSSPNPNHNPNAVAASTSAAAPGAPAATKQKKTVTFKNILETSDDKSVVKRFYNPDNRVPLVSIMKKDSLNRPLNYCRGSEFIVRPSILSKILNKNSNIDKLNSLKFRSVHAPSASIQESSSSSTNLFGSGLSRAFGAPMDDEDAVSGGVTFRKQEPQHKTPEDNDDDG